MQQNKGFTLVELMIVVAIIAILAGVALPSYQEQLSVSRRADAQSALISFANAMERYYTENNTYTAAATAGADTGTPTIFSTEAPLDGATKYYDLTIFAAAASTYELRAAPKNNQANDQCGTLTVTHTGVRGLNSQDAGIVVNDCWR